MRSRARLGGSRSEIVTGFRLAGWPIRDRPDRLGGITIDAVLSHGIAHTAGEQAVRLARRNSDQLGPIRRGAGPRPDLRNTVAIVVAETLIPSLSSSPSMRM